MIHTSIGSVLKGKIGRFLYHEKVIWLFLQPAQCIVWRGMPREKYLTACIKREDGFHRPVLKIYNIHDIGTGSLSDRAALIVVCVCDSSIGARITSWTGTCNDSR